MASNKRIKGITIEIGGDVTKLDRALNEATKDINKTQAALKDVDRLLKLDPSNVELLDQKQRLLSQAVEQTAERYQTLKRTLEESTASNVKFEEWTQAQSRLQGEITKTSNTLRDLEQEQRKLAEIGFPADSSQMQEIQTKIDATKEKLANLNQQVVDTYNEMGRPLSIEQYDSLQRELVESEQAYKEAQQAAENFENGVDETGKTLEDVGGGVSELSSTLGAFGLSASFLTLEGAINIAKDSAKKFGAAIGTLIVDGASYGDDVQTLATKFGLTTDAVQEFMYMEGLADTSISTITGSLSRMIRNMEQARDGTGQAAEAFQKLGVPVTDSTGALRDSMTVFLNVIDALGQIQNGTERDALAMDIFGRSAMELNPLIAIGSDGIRRFAQEAHDMGYVLDTESIKAMSAVQDQFDRIDNATTAFKNKLMVELAPQILEITDRILERLENLDIDALAKSVSAMIQRWATDAEVLLDIIDKITGRISSLTSAWQSGGFGGFTGEYLFGAIGGGKQNSSTASSVVSSGGTKFNGSERSVIINFSGSNAAVGAALQPYVQSEKSRVGSSFVTGKQF